MPEGQGSRSAKETDTDDISFIRTEDVICLVCTSGDAMKRGYLAAEGFGSQVCHLEPEARNKEPSELWKCTFQLEDALSVHAMYTRGMRARETKQGSRKILMYGHAVLLRHVGTKKLLRCLSTSPSSDKMAYNIGFTEQPDKSTVDESCWFIVRPASKQRSEGEKVRAGDDIFLVNVANERFLSAQLSFFYNPESDSLSTSKQPLNTVQASFVQCVWSLHIVCSGSAREAAIGYVNGGDVVRFIHRNGGEDCLAVGARDSDKNIAADRTPGEVCYEARSKAQLRSLWRVELFKMRFGGGFTSWGQPFRLRHVVSGKFLGVKEERRREGCEGEGKEQGSRPCVALLDPSEASMELSAFCFTTAVNGHAEWTEQRVEGMGTPQVKFGDSDVLLLHLTSKKLVGCPVSERVRHWTPRGGRKVVMQGEAHQSFLFTVTRAPEEQAKAASIVQLSEDTMRNCVHNMSCDHLADHLLHILSDLCYYFSCPNEHSLNHDEFQQRLCILRERQNLFQAQGMLLFVLGVITKTGEKCLASSATMVDIHHKLYELLAAMIRGNHNNCREFATPEWLNVFIGQLHMPSFTHDVLEVIQCLLTDSPEVLNNISESHIEVMVNLLSTRGRDAKVMKLLSSLCVCHGVAMRDKQRLICKHLLNNCRDLLLHTSLHDHVHCVHPTLYLGRCEGSASFKKWYFEAEVTQLSLRTVRPPHFRVGWAHASLFHPRPASNSFSTTSGGVGDDVFSLGFDGHHFWVGGHCIEPSRGGRRLQRQESVRSPSTTDTLGPVSVGDVIGCCLDLEEERAWFSKNGSPVPGYLHFSLCGDMITPAISFSAGVSAVMSFGGHLGRLRHGPPPGFAGLFEASQPTRDVRLQPFLCLGVFSDLIVAGPTILADHQGFVPAPIDTSQVSLPDPVMRIRDKLAKNIHDIWAKNKIEAGYSYSEVRNDDLKHNPSLKPFEDLSEMERRYDYEMALETLSTLVALGCQISSQVAEETTPRVQELPPERYCMSNGYLPQPLDLEGVRLQESLLGLVERLAENTHNVWAANRIQEGWTYGMASDSESKRNPLLVPYSKLDESAKKSNRDTAYESVRTVCALGCTIESPSASDFCPIQQLAREFTDTLVRTRTFRGQTCYTLRNGKWYYEVKLLTEGMMRVGWATPSFPAGQLLGTDEHSYAFDGFRACKWRNGSEGFGHRWKKGDIVGCLLDLDRGTMSFTLNGELLQDFLQSTFAFEHVSEPDGLVPAITLWPGEEAQLNFGKSQEALHFDFTDSGYEPVCSTSSLHYNIPLWYSSNHGAFQIIDPSHLRLKTERKCLTQHGTSIISVNCKDWDYSKHAKQECLRLNIGVAVSPHNASPSSIHPRPGPLSPSPISETYLFPGFSDCSSPKKMNVSYSVIVPAGQDPHVVFVGWTTAGFKYIESQFRSRSRRRSGSMPLPLSYGQQVEVVSTWRRRTSRGAQESGETQQSAHYSTAFMVCVCELLTRTHQHLPAAVKVSCVVDTISGSMTFSATMKGDQASGHTATREVSLKANTNCKLFPTVVVTPSTERVVDFDFTPDLLCHPLTHVLIASRPGAKPSLCPPRMRLMALEPSQWLRQPTQRASFSIHPAPGGAFQLSANRETVYSIFTTLPEEDTVMDILEISEDHQLLDFHIQTLQAYRAVSSHSNLKIAEEIGALLDTEQLLQCLKLDGMRFSLRAAYFQLLSELHLEHDVRTRLMMRGEFILPRSECTRSVPLFCLAAQQPPKQVFRIAAAPLPGLDPALRNQANISHNITSTFSRMAFRSKTFPLSELKELVFGDLECLLVTGYYRGQILPCQDSSEIFVPLLQVLDQLLVVGAIQEDRDLKRLLAMLDPEEFTAGKKKFLHGLLSREVAAEEPMKLVLCQLLQHLCDCQVQHRIEAIVTFAHGYVESLQAQQRERHKRDFKKKPKEFRSSPEKQVESMLSFCYGSGPDCHLDSSQQQQLKVFHEQLKQHCGSGSGTLGPQLEDMGVREKLQLLASLILTSEEQCKKKCLGGRVTTLQQIITRTMLEWGSKEMRSMELVGEIFLLLYRQYDEIHEVAEALRKSYIIEVSEDSTGKPNYDIPAFRHALGSLRILQKIGMGKKEENLLKDSLRVIRNSDIFFCHPHLLRSLGVHLTVLGLMQSYLGISSGSGVHDQVLSVRRKKRLSMFKEGLPPPVEACCKFLCKFARISYENQMALFKHIGYLLEHSEKYPGLMTNKGYTPLDVATATIKDNQELALALEESHLEHVVALLVATTTTVNNGSNDLEDALGVVAMGSMLYEWAPNGGEKCLEFLQSAVWVENEQIKENAHIVVRLLIHNSECLGPSLAGDALGLRKVFEEAIEQLAGSPRPSSPQESAESSPPLRSYESTQSTASMSSHLTHQSSSLLVLSEQNARHILSFYTSLIRLLACCAPSPSRSTLTLTDGSKASQFRSGSEDRTCNILRNLIKVEEIVGILSLPFTQDAKSTLCPSHKEAALLFLERVYGITTPELLLQLLTDAFLPDIKTALKLLKSGEQPHLHLSLCRYVCISMLPLLSGYAPVFRQLLSHLHVIDNLLMCCFRLGCSPQLSGPQLEEVATFLVTVVRELHPRVILRFMPKLIADIPSLQTNSLVALKLLSSHYEYFARYYENGMLGKTSESVGQASEEEKMYSALVVYRLLDTLAKKLPSCPQMLRSSISCLKAVSRALVPDCLVPSQALLNTMFNSSSASYDPHPVNTSRVVLGSELVKFVEKFAAHLHDCWIYEKQTDGWGYGPEKLKGDLLDPNMKPFTFLSEQDRVGYSAPAEELVKYLLARGWSLNKVRAGDTRNVPLKPSTLCGRRRAQSFSRSSGRPKDFAAYVPEVLDLSKVETPVELLAMAEQMAENAHDQWARDLKTTDKDYLSHPRFLPYELLDEAVKEERRTHALDLLRFLRVSGFELSRTRVSLLSLAHASQSSQSQEKFALQLFEKFLDLLSQELEMDFYLKVLFPVMAHYLRQHAGYFVPLGCQRRHSYASRGEKTRTLQMFCQVVEFIQRHQLQLFHSVKVPTQQFMSPQGEIGGNAETNQMTARGVVSLLEAIVGAMDVSGTAHRSQGGVAVVQCSEIMNFFRQASSAIQLTSKNIGKPDKVDAQFHFYCLRVLLPTLTAFFNHLGAHTHGKHIIVGQVLTHSRCIFQHLVEMAAASGPVFVGSSPLIAIGQCMGAFALAYPEPFLKEAQLGFSLQYLLDQLRYATIQGATCGNVLFVADVIIPVLTNYVFKWLSDDITDPSVTVEHVDEVLTQVLSLIAAHFGQAEVKWLHRVIETTVVLSTKCSVQILRSHFVPLLEELRERAIGLWQDEQYLTASWVRLTDNDQASEKLEALIEDYRIFVRDLTSLLPFLAVFLKENGEALRRPETDSSCEASGCFEVRPVQVLFVSVTDIFHCWFSSQHLRREFQSATQWLTQHAKKLFLQSSLCLFQRPGERGGYSGTQGNQPPNILLLCLELLLPINDQFLLQEDRELVDKYRKLLGKKGATPEDTKMDILKELESRAAYSRNPKQLTRQLTRKLIQPFLKTKNILEERALCILSLARVRHRIQQVQHPVSVRSRWRQLFTQRKRKAVLRCFLAVPYFQLAKHRAINLFLQAYRSMWLMSAEQANHDLLTEELLDRQDFLQPRHDPLSQLFTMFKRKASAGECINETLYTSYADVLSKSVIGAGEEDDKMADDNATTAYELYYEHKAMLIVKQGQLSRRGASSMVLLVVTAADGTISRMVHSTLRLGIALLKEGNQRIQCEMLEQLKGMDVGFLSSISQLITSCSVLNWSAYERYKKSESRTPTSSSCCKVFPEFTFTVSLFRFLQLLCEGHNEDFQNYLRTQAGNTTTVNIIICTVDYLLRLQESISDFYWHYSDHDTIDLQGRQNFLKAFKVARQVFRTLTEYIQGPCVQNQEVLARSRLLDAVSGFLQVFAVLERMLYRDTSQVELLRELLELQQEMYILLLSMLEGSAMSSNIGKLMVNMLMESAQHIEDIMGFFSIFVKLKDVTTSKAFKEYDLNKDGMISYREFETAMEAQQRYNKEEIAYLMECADTNKDGLLDYMEFTERFHQPAENIGFHLCVLIVHLMDHLPDDKRLERFWKNPQGRELIDHFKRNMGCIEIQGKSCHVERVYFEVKEVRLRQWEETQIQESTHYFLHTVETGSQKSKLCGFVNFCEDTIFEMDYADKISGAEHLERESRAKLHRKKHNRTLQLPSQPFLSRIRARVNALRRDHTPLERVVAWMAVLWILTITKLIPAAQTTVHFLREKAGAVFRAVKVEDPPSASPSLQERRGKKPSFLKLPIKPPAVKVEESKPLPTRPSQEGRKLAFSLTPPERTASHHRSQSVTGRSMTPDAPRERSGSIHTPRPFHQRQLKLAYDRSRMKPPSQIPESSGPTPESRDQTEGDSYTPKITIPTHGWQAFLARNYYLLNNLKFLATFLINILLLTFTASELDDMSASSQPLVVSLQDPLRVSLRTLASLHFLFSVVLIISYWILKVPLIIFKREKYIARQLESKQMWIRQRPTSLADQWDGIVVSARSFPHKYWDKQVKQRVCDQFVSEKQKKVAKELGMEVKSKFDKRTKWDVFLETLHSLVDLRYWVWVLGVVLSNVMILYHIGYCGLSFVGLRWSSFYYSIHLIDLIMNIKILRTVLRSVLLNGRQLAMTILMTCVIIYIYTVIAFNFFRKFYKQQTREGEEEFVCESMARCFIYHIDQGLRSGGGIADKLESASGDPNEFMRLFFDITFFFVVIVILLAIIQGLIIDSFGELRDREESVTHEMQTKCFVCGLPKSEFDHIPHGFDNHISKEHNMAHYMFFLLYLIKKEESEFSGQESYVWEMYLKQNWDFFPVGDCFRKQEERKEHPKKRLPHIQLPPRKARTK